MSKIRNTGITDQWGFRHPCYVATASQYLKDFHNSSLWPCSHVMNISRNENIMLAFGWFLTWLCRFKQTYLDVKRKWNEWGFRLHLCTYRLKWATGTSAGCGCELFLITLKLETNLALNLTNPNNLHTLESARHSVMWGQKWTKNLKMMDQEFCCGLLVYCC